MISEFKVSLLYTQFIDQSIENKKSLKTDKLIKKNQDQFIATLPLLQSQWSVHNTWWGALQECRQDNMAKIKI